MLLHELAHIRNGDVSLAYLTLSIWWAFLATALLPAAAAGVLYVDWARPQREALGTAILAIDTGLITSCILFVRNAVLRARELYADARSFAWHGDAAGLARVLSSLAPIPRSRRFISPHPAPSERQRLITDTDEMFRCGTWDSFGTGLSAGIAGVSLFIVTITVLNPGNILTSVSTIAMTLALTMPLLIVIPFAAGATAIGTWRAAFFALMRGQQRAPIFRTAAACAIGAVAGGLLPTAIAMVVIAADVSVGTSSEQPAAVNATLVALIVLAGCLLIVLALTLALAAFLAWVEVTARCWLAARLPHASPGPVFVLCLTLTLFVATPWVIFAPWGMGLTLYGMYNEWHSTGGGLVAIFEFVASTAQVLPFGPITWFGLVALWAFPLSAGLVSRRRTVGSWVFLGTAPSRTPDLPGFPVYLRRAVVIGAAGGMAGIVASALLYGLGPSEAESFGLLMPRLVTGAIVEGLVAVLTVLLISGVAIPHAMCAAFVAGCLFAGGEILRIVLQHWRLSFNLITLVILPFALFDGALVALVCASATSLLAAPVRWFHTNSRQHSRDRMLDNIAS